MAQHGTELQKKAYHLFDEREKITREVRDSNMGVIRKNFLLYVEKIEILDSLLDNLSPLLGPEELAEELEEFPDFENLVFHLDGYTYESRVWIFKSDIEEFRSILSKKIEKYKKYTADIAANTRVS